MIRVHKKKRKQPNKSIYIKCRKRCNNCTHQDNSCFIDWNDRTVRTKFFNFGQAEDIKDGEQCRFYSRKVEENE